MTVVPLTGCRPEPLGAYLKALGVLRLVGQQRDPVASGRWTGDVFRIDSTLGATDLVDFFAEEYQPTPVLSPWNKDSGFKAAGSKATEALLRLEATTDSRLGAYRAALAASRQVMSRPGWGACTKAEQVTLLRNSLPDAALEWLDAAVVLQSEKPVYPTLLGTGGNFGRLELSPTFIARLQQVLDPAKAAHDRSRAWLRAALFEEGSPALRTDPVGQFDPGAAGGLRASTIGGSPLTNPWDFVLLIEGALIWASGVARRLGGGAALAAVPFSVAPSAVGQGSLVPGERAKAELWAPLWDQPLDIGSLRRLFAEGRISWSAGQAKNGLDVARAVHSLGVDVGISGFVRHVVAERMGQSPLAVPVGRFDVKLRPEVGVLSSLDGWIDRLRRAVTSPGAPTSMVRAANRVDRALLEAVSGSSVAFQDLLIAVAAAEALCGRTERGRSDGLVRPVDWLDTAAWFSVLDDGASEFRLAFAIATASDGHLVGSPLASVRSAIRPVEVVARGARRSGRVQWRRESALVPGCDHGDIVTVLSRVLVLRSERRDDSDQPDRGETGQVRPWFRFGYPAGPGDAESLACGALDLDRLSELVPGLLLLRPMVDTDDMSQIHTAGAAVACCPAWRILAPFYSRHDVTIKNKSVELRPVSTWARQLLSGNVEPVIGDALLRWRLAGFRPVYNPQSVSVLAGDVEGGRLAAALLCGTNRREVNEAASAVVDIEDQRLSEGEQ